MDQEKLSQIEVKSFNYKLKILPSPYFKEDDFIKKPYFEYDYFLIDTELKKVDEYGNEDSIAILEVEYEGKYRNRFCGIITVKLIKGQEIEEDLYYTKKDIIEKVFLDPENFQIKERFDSIFRKKFY